MLTKTSSLSVSLCQFSRGKFKQVSQLKHGRVHHPIHTAQWHLGQQGKIGAGPAGPSMNVTGWNMRQLRQLRKEHGATFWRLRRTSSGYGSCVILGQLSYVQAGQVKWNQWVTVIPTCWPPMRGWPSSDFGCLGGFALFICMDMTRTIKKWKPWTIELGNKSHKITDNNEKFTTPIQILRTTGAGLTDNHR